MMDKHIDRNKRISLEGTIRQASYSGASTIDMPNGYLLFRLEGQEAPLIIAGRNIPSSIVNGQYAIVKAVRRLHNGEVFIVDDLVFSESKEGRVLGTYRAT